MRRESWIAKRFTARVLALDNVVDINGMIISHELGRNLKPYKVQRVNIFRSPSGDWLGVNEIRISNEFIPESAWTCDDLLEKCYDTIRDSKTTYFKSCRYSKGHYILRLHIIE